MEGSGVGDEEDSCDGVGDGVGDGWGVVVSEGDGEGVGDGVGVGLGVGLETETVNTGPYQPAQKPLSIPEALIVTCPESVELILTDSIVLPLKL